MLHIIHNNKENIWDNIVKSFSNWDVYYLYEYAYSLYLHGDGVPILVYYEDGGESFCYVIMQKDIAHSRQFYGLIKEGFFYDWETPYGYGGPLSDSGVSLNTQENFQRELRGYCEKHGIISQFIRFHPLLNNYDLLSKVISYKYLRDTICLNTDSVESILNNMTANCRNKVRKSERNGIKIVYSDVKDVDSFIDMYHQTMVKNHADEYYIFKRDYFDSFSSFADSACIFYALYNNKPICAALCLFNDQFIHYHLVASDVKYLNDSPKNIFPNYGLLYYISCWAAEHGMKFFHLGGGLLPDDALFKFKSQFNKNLRLSFYVGRTIFDEEKYDYLLGVREKNENNFDRNNSFMIQYRK